MREDFFFFAYFFLQALSDTHTGINYNGKLYTLITMDDVASMCTVQWKVELYALFADSSELFALAESTAGNG